MDDLKLFAKSKNQIHSLVETVHKFSEDIGIQMVIKKCGLLIMEREKKLLSQIFLDFQMGNT